MKNVAIYCRVSTAEQANFGESVEDQLYALRNWVSDNDCRIVGEYLDEGFSARKSYSKRPELKKLLSDLQTGEIEMIIFTKLDRWFRNLSDYYKVQDVLDKYGTTWKAILEDYTTENSEGVFKINLMLSFAQREADITSDRIKFTFAQKRARGEITSGRMPVGYVTKDKKPVKDESKREAIQAFWDTYLSVGSMNKAREAAQQNGLFLALNVCSLMLRNASKYAGSIQNCPCEPYITAEQAEFVLSTRKKAPRKSGRIYLFSGIIYCRECGGRFAAHLNRFGKAKDKFRIIYNCTCHNIRQKEDRCTCKVNIVETDVEQELLRNLSTILHNKKIEAELVKAEQKKKRDVTQERTKLLQKQERLLDIYLDGAIDKTAYNARKQAIQEELDALEEEPEEPVIEPEAYDAILPDNWQEIYSALDTKHKREFWFRTLSRIEIGSDRSVNVVSFCLPTT